MSIYSSLVFVHLLGTVGMAAAMATEGVALGRPRPELGPLQASLRLGVLAMLVTFASGVWMMVTLWGPAPWLAGAVVAMLGMAAIGGVVSLRHVRRLLLEPSAPIPPALHAAFRVRLAIGLAIVALMTFKPSSLGAVLVLVLGVLAGVVADRLLRPRVPSAVTS